MDIDPRSSFDACFDFGIDPAEFEKIPAEPNSDPQYCFKVRLILTTPESKNSQIFFNIHKKL